MICLPRKKQAGYFLYSPRICSWCERNQITFSNHQLFQEYFCYNELQKFLICLVLFQDQVCCLWSCVTCPGVLPFICLCLEPPCMAFTFLVFLTVPSSTFTGFENHFIINCYLNMAIFNPDRQSFGMLISLVKAWQKCHWRGQLEGVLRLHLILIYLHMCMNHHMLSL